MVIIDFVDGTKKTYETRGNEKEPWSFDSVEQCYKIETIKRIYKVDGTL